MQQQSFFGTVQNVTTCPECGGSGQIIEHKCSDCNGTGFISKKKRIEVAIPAGIDDGQSIRIRGKGEPGQNGGPRGDLLVEVRVSQSPEFHREGFDVYSIADISFAQAALGGEILIKTLDGQVLYEVKPGTQPNTRIRLRGKGIPTIRNANIRGDQYVTLRVLVPTGLTLEAKEALRAFDAVNGNTLQKPVVQPEATEKKKRGPFGRKKR